MEQIVFIHGSSEGQSLIVPSGYPKDVCNDIANKYFQGRIGRQKASDATLSLFVELYRTTFGDTYCVYSFVNNSCLGVFNRPGQYFAISILTKNRYAYPESIFRMLDSAYRQMLETGKIIRHNEEGQDQYVIAQFNAEEDYLLAFIHKIEEFSLKLISNHNEILEVPINYADYSNWNGARINIDSCNSISAYSILRENGRVIISDEYDSPTEKIKALEEKIKKIEDKKKEEERKRNNSYNSEKLKAKKEIEELNGLLEQKDTTILKLQQDNEKYIKSIKIVKDELEKVSKANKSIANIHDEITTDQKHSKIDLLKLCLLFLILILTIISCLFSYSFFRDQPTHSSSEVSEYYKRPTPDNKDIQQQTPQINNSNSLQVLPYVIIAPAEGLNEKYLKPKEWSKPELVPDWIEISVSDETLIIKIMKNETSDERSHTYCINDAQYKIRQQGIPPDYIITVKKGDLALNDGDQIARGSKIKAKVENPGNSNNYGWKYDNCEGQTKNLKEVNITINGEVGKKAIISYGRPGSMQTIELSITENRSSMKSSSQTNNRRNTGTTDTLSTTNVSNAQEGGSNSTAVEGSGTNENLNTSSEINNSEEGNSSN